MRVTAFIAAFCTLACIATGAEAAAAKKPTTIKTTSAPPTSCTGTFSNGVPINVGAAVYMPDVGYVTGGKAIGADAQTACDVHTFAWNQFLYWTQGGSTPRFMGMAPWYNVLTTGAKPGAYSGG